MIQSGNYFILWSNNGRATALEEQFSPEHVICSAEELRTAKLGLADGIIVLCELNWDENGIEREPSIFCGVDLVKHYLRVSMKFHAPILLVSFMPESFFESEPKYMIMNAVGHRFKQLDPSLFGTLHSIFDGDGLNPLNDIQLSDIVTNLCDLRGLIDEILHNAQSNIMAVIKSENIDINTKFEKISQILDKHLKDVCLLLNQRPDVRSAIKEIIRLFNEDVKQKGDFHAAKTFLKKYQEQLKSLVNDTEAPSVPIRHEWGWKALLLDDDPEGIKEISDMLEKNGVVTEVFSDVVEAKKKIDDDEQNGNYITVVISDYRLFEPGKRCHQRKQGYDFLLEMSMRDRFYALIALSGLSRSFLLESFRKYNRRVEVYAKDDIIASERATLVFTENIIQLGEENYQALLSKPTAKNWEGVLKPFYVDHRQSADYAQHEHQINLIAREYVLYVKHILNASDKNLLQMTNFEPFKGLTTNLVGEKDKKPILIHRPVFQQILIARRIAIWLLFFEGFNTRSVYSTLIRGILDESYLKIGTSTLINSENTKLKSSVANLLNTTLCLSLNDFPKNLLVEEIGWLKYDMGVDIDHMQTVLLQVHEHFNEGHKHYPKLIEFMSNQLMNLENDNSKTKKYHELKQNIHEDHGKLNFTIASIGDLKRVVRYMGAEIRNLDLIHMAINMLEDILTTIDGDARGVLDMDGVIKYVSDNIEILNKRKLSRGYE